MTVKKPREKQKNWRGSPSPDGLSRKNEKAMRRCLVTRETLPVDRLIRFCVSPQQELLPDLAGKLPGRGLWVTADKDLIAAACSKGIFSKAAHKKVNCPDNMDELMRRLFIQRLKSLMGLAKKAGLVITGFEKVVQFLHKSRPLCILEAVDAALDGQEKINRLCARMSIPVFEVLTSEQMSEALGNENCVHAALKSGGVTNLFVAEVRRFAAYCKKEQS